MKRIVIIGTGGRGTESYAAALLKEFPDTIQIAGFFDINPLRAEAANLILGTRIPVFASAAAMLSTVQPHAVIVTSKDSTHAEYVVQALDAGVDVISEKPLCTTRAQVTAIRAAAARSVATGCVTHNLRFTPDIEDFKRLLVDGAVGRVLSMHFTETLDRYHGADYFRRWHRFMDNSAGLMVHKASHHFDVLNWLAASRPATVTAQGRLAFYGRNGARRGPRCSACPHASQCEFYADVFRHERSRLLYQGPEVVDGYFRDGCVFDERIDIPDTVAATITYENGIVASYSLTAYASYESMHLAVEGSRGRLELYQCYGTSWAVGHPSGPAAVSLANDGNDVDDRRRFLWFLPHEQRLQAIPERQVSGGHGGSDPRLRALLFGAANQEDPLGMKAPLEDGIQAVLVGVSANDSMAAGGLPICVQTGAAATP